MMAANAGAFTVPAKIVWLRSYVNGAYFVNINTARLSGGGTCTTVYKVNQNQPGAKTIIATLLSAKAMNDSITIELDNTGCKGWGTLITSVFIL